MRIALAAASVTALSAAGGLVGWYVMSRPDPSYVSSADARGFNVQRGAAPAPFEPRPAPAPSREEQLRDAVAAPVSPKPIPIQEMSPIPSMQAPPEESPAPVADARPAAAPSPKIARWARGQKVFRALLRAPASFMMSQGALRAPRALRAFLDDKKAVERYLNSPLVRAALKDPATAKSLLSSPVLLSAFVSTPAMRDPASVRALAGSRMLRKMLDCPGVQEALSDPKVQSAIAGDPHVIEWLGSHPEALRALGSVVPSLADALSTGL